MGQVIAARLLNHQHKLFICFIDLKKARDEVRNNQMLDAIDEVDVDDKDLRLLQNVYWQQKAIENVGDEKIVWVKLEFAKIMWRHHCSTATSARK